MLRRSEFNQGQVLYYRVMAEHRLALLRQGARWEAIEEQLRVQAMYHAEQRPQLSSALRHLEDARRLAKDRNDVVLQIHSLLMLAKVRCASASNADDREEAMVGTRALRTLH